MNKINVGGQAVIEGVMMRSPRAFAIAVRRPDNRIELSIRKWVSIWEKLRFLRLPFMRGSVVLLETLFNGISALNFSAKVNMPEENKDKKQSDMAIILTMIIAFGIGLFLFVVLPHYLTIFFSNIAGNELDVSSVMFHIVDGIIKVGIFLLYIYLISQMKDIKRVFMYHGAEHKSIFAYENGEDLTIENVRKYITYHPRCGTSFLLIVILVSIFVFAVIFPFVPKIFTNKWLNNAIMVLIKIILLLPIAGISYEFLKFSSKYQGNIILKMLIYPGLLLQRITTRPPTEDMLEVAIISILAVLKEEENPQDHARIMTFDSLEDFKSRYLILQTDAVDH
ncbi:MAG: DUF1385 domain-containing protein [Deltaproteobacteria bacterium]|nr:DUF1385 domain-containing protein [Deltaproteobacteria bacterium]